MKSAKQWRCPFIEDDQTLARKGVKEVDDSRFATMGMDQFRFGDGSGGHEKIADLLDVVGLKLLGR